MVEKSLGGIRSQAARTIAISLCQFIAGLGLVQLGGAFQPFQGEPLIARHIIIPAEPARQQAHRHSIAPLCPAVEVINTIFFYFVIHRVI